MNIKYTIINLYATTLEDGSYKDIAESREVFKGQDTPVIRGYGVASLDSGFLVQDTEDFYYTYEDALEGLKDSKDSQLP